MTRLRIDTALLVALTAALAVGCGSDDESGTSDTGASDAGDVGVDVGDVSAPDNGGVDTEVDAADDAVEEVGPPRCQPGFRGCSSETTAQFCDDDGFLQEEECQEGAVCFGGECGFEGTCEPYEVTSCVDFDTYEGCNAVGTARGEFAVPPDRTCITEDGESGLVERLCRKGQQRCTDERTLEACAPSGLEWQFATDCFEDDETSICDDGSCIPLCEFIEKRKTYIGCEYWAVDLDNAFVRAGGSVPYFDAFGAQFAVVVANPSELVTAEVAVHDHDGLVRELSVEPGSLEVINLPEAALNGTMRGFESFQIQSTVPIIAYQFNPLENEEVFSNDASMLFPTSSLGTEYLLMTRRQTFDQLKGYVTVIATQPGVTAVEIEFPPYTPENPVITLSGDAIPPMRGGEQFEVELEQFEVINIETNREGADLTGTRITSDRVVAVFGGSEASNAPNDDSCIFRERQGDWVCEADRETPCLNRNGEPDITLCSDFITCCADHLEQQMLPIFAWGQRFNATRSFPRGDEADVWRIMAGAERVRVTLVGLPEPSEYADFSDRYDVRMLRDFLPTRREFELNRGEWIEFQSPFDFEIVATGPITVGQFLAAERAPYSSSLDGEAPPHEDAGTGDPAFILGVPVEQYRSDYIFLAPNAYEFDYVTITAPVGAEVFLDDELVGEDEWIEFGRGTYHVARLPIADGVHTVEADEPVGVMVHGYDQFVSYGYPAGLDVEEIFRR